LNTIAWTGGSCPPATIRRDIFYLQLRRGIFRESIATNAEFWGTVALDTARTLWNRASYDAWATIRQRRGIDVVRYRRTRSRRRARSR
jgi:hypothetical protein